MALVKKLKKGGVSRWVLKGATSGDYFVVPRGFKVLGNLTVENTTQLNGTGTLSLGKNIGINDVYTITVTSAYTGTGTCTWGGGVVNAATVVSATQATAIAALAGGVTGAAQLAASAAAIALNQPTLTGVYGNMSLFNVTAVGATIVLTGAVPGAATPAPTLSSTGAATFSAFVHTTTGSVDATYMSPVVVPATTAGSVSLIPIVSPVASPTAVSNLAVSSYNGNSLTTTYTTTNTATGTYNLCGQPITIPYNATTALTAPQIGILMGGRSVYSATLAYSSSGNVTVNGIVVASGGNIAATVAALNNAQIPGWIAIAATTTLFMCATRSGATPLPTIVTGGFITLTNINSQVGFYIPGYLNDSVTPITNTITFATAATSTGTYAINGTLINIPYINATATTLAAISAIAAGCAWYTATIGTSSAGTNYINGALFTASATPTTTASALTTLANIPGRTGDVGGWVCTSPGAGAVILFIAQTPGYMSAPVFSAGAVAAPVLSGVTLNQGFTLNGYTVTYDGTHAVWVGPAPVFTTPAPPSGTTTAAVYTLAGSTGVSTIYTDYNNPGASLPTFSNGATAPAGTTVTYTTTQADTPYYLNFSNSAMHGNVNVTMEIEKFS